MVSYMHVCIIWHPFFNTENVILLSNGTPDSHFIIDIEMTIWSIIKSMTNQDLYGV